MKENLEKVEIPHLEEELAAANDVYCEIKDKGQSYQFARKSRPCSSASSLLKDIGYTLSMFTNVALSSDDSS